MSHNYKLFEEKEFHSLFRLFYQKYGNKGYKEILPFIKGDF